MADFGISGINTGMDTSLIIEKLVALNKRPIDIIASKSKVEQQKLANFKDLQSRLQTFKSIVNTLNTKDRFIATKGTFTNNNTSATTKVVDITTTSQASSGVHSFSVLALAKESKILSEGFSAINSTVSNGRFELRVGGNLTTINIDSSNNTLEGLRLAINNSGANVKADYINDGSSISPIRLMISGTQTGAENALTATLISSSGFAGDVETMAFTETQTAQNASLIVNGLSVSKSSNLVTDVLPGAILTLTGTGEGTITVATDVDAIKQKINNFINGYNDIIGYINQQLTVDQNNNTGVLFGNNAILSLQSSLRNSVSETVLGTTGSYSFLSQVGIRTQQDGTLLANDGDISAALANNLVNVSQVFSSQGTSTNSAVTYVGFTDKTNAGTFDIRVQNGVPQVSVSGQNNYTDAVGSGNFWSGAVGTEAEGLNFRISTTANGSYGSITQTIGVAEKLNREIRNQTDLSRGGPLSSEINTSNKTIADYDKTILAQQDRLKVFEDNLKSKFSNMEVVVGKLKSQGAAFASALGGATAAGASSAK